jgi:hypothetical protein
LVTLDYYNTMPVDVPNTAKVRLPEFMASDPAIWLELCESAFSVHGVTEDSDKYNVMIVALPVQVLAKVKEIVHLAKSIKTDKFKLLKNKILQLYARSPIDQYSALCAVPPLQANQRPSDLLSTMSACVQGLDIESWIFLSMFLCKLPTSIRAQCTAQNFFDKIDLQKVAVFADRCAEGNGTPSSPLPVFNVSECDVIRPGSDVISPLTAVPSPTCACTNVATTRELCWYHAKFGKNAQKCKPDCTYTPKQGNLKSAPRR